MKVLSSWEEILFGVPQGSILGPLLFNIFMCDLFLIVNDEDFANYADDNTPFASGNTPVEVLECLDNASIKLFEWFSNNQMKANPDKCHLLTSSMTPTSINIKGHIAKARQKVHVLARIAWYMHISKRKLIMNSFFTSQFNYCSLVWMCHSCLINIKINRLHET